MKKFHLISAITRTIFTVALLFSILSCRKNPTFRLLVREYPSLAPAAGAKMKLNKCGFDLSGCKLKEIGVYTSDANGMIETDQEFDAVWSAVIEGGGYIPAGYQNDKLDIPEYYAARPGWMLLKVRNITPASADDICYMQFTLADTLKLLRRTGNFLNDGILASPEFLGAVVDKQFLYKFPGDASAKMHVNYANTLMDSTLVFYIPKNDTITINFDY